MVTMTPDKIAGLVRLKIDEIGANDSDMIGADKDDAELTSIIKAVIPDALRLVLLGADVSMLEGTNDNTSLSVSDSLVASKKLPDDFLRFLSARLSSWSSAVHEVISEDSAEYRQQSDTYACGTPERPVAALVRRSDGRYIEMFKAKSKSDTLNHFVYIKQPSSADSYDVPAQLSEALTWYAAGLTLTAVRDDHAEKCLDVAKGLMGNQTTTE